MVVLGHGGAGAVAHGSGEWSTTRGSRALLRRRDGVKGRSSGETRLCGGGGELDGARVRARASFGAAWRLGNDDVGAGKRRIGP